MLRRSYLRLIERKRNQFMHAMIPNVSNRENQGVARLPLQIKGPVFRVGQRIPGIVAAEKQRGASRSQIIVVAIRGCLHDQILDVRNESLDRGETGRRWWRRSVTKRNPEGP